jgi:hypothetical protein
MILGNLKICFVFVAPNKPQLSSFPNVKYYPFTETEIDVFYRAIFLDSGLIGVMLTVILAQLTPQLLCEQFPVLSLNLPVLPWLCIKIALYCEKRYVIDSVLIFVIHSQEICNFFSGITHFCYVLRDAFARASAPTAAHVANSDVC